MIMVVAGIAGIILTLIVGLILMVRGKKRSAVPTVTSEDSEVVNSLDTELLDENGTELLDINMTEMIDTNKTKLLDSNNAASL